MKLVASVSSWNCRCGNNHGKFACRVPPSPDVMAAMYMEYKRSSQLRNENIRAISRQHRIYRSVRRHGRDGRRGAVRGDAGRAAAPCNSSQAVVGEMKVKVLLVEFPDRPGVLERSHYEDLLFSEGKYPTGSMRDYYKEASHGKVDVTGTVHGWLKMPQPYSYYTNGKSGNGMGQLSEQCSATGRGCREGCSRRWRKIRCIARQVRPRHRDRALHHTFRAWCGSKIQGAPGQAHLVAQMEFQKIRSRLGPISLLRSI